MKTPAQLIATLVARAPSPLCIMAAAPPPLCHELQSATDLSDLRCSENSGHHLSLFQYPTCRPVPCVTVPAVAAMVAPPLSLRSPPRAISLANYHLASLPSSPSCSPISSDRVQAPPRRPVVADELQATALRRTPVPMLKSASRTTLLCSLLVPLTPSHSRLDQGIALPSPSSPANPEPFPSTPALFRAQNHPVSMPIARAVTVRF